MAFNTIIDSSKIMDNMKTYEFRFQKKQNFSEYILPLTKNNEQYLLIKQKDNQYNFIHYYIIANRTQVIGRFDIGVNTKSCGITYHIIEEFQNRGIGQTVLGFVVEDIFNNHNVDRIIILPINERSVAIASKIGFTPKSQGAYELKSLDYQNSQSNRKQK